MSASLDSAQFSASFAHAEEAISKGNRDEARQIFVQLTTADPSSERAWLGLADSAEVLEEKITALNQVLTLNPNNTNARQALYEAMHQLLLRDPSLVYQSETNSFYQIRGLADFQFTHPKDREFSEPFHPSKRSLLHASFRWLGWSLVGLIPAGVGTLVCAPIAMLMAIKLLRQSASPADHRRAWIILWGAMGLWLIALAFIYILVLHII